MLFLTDVPGVLDKNKQIIEELKVADIPGLIADGTITGGMIPKVETCIYAIERGVEGVKGWFTDEHGGLRPDRLAIVAGAVVGFIALRAITRRRR